MRDGREKHRRADRHRRRAIGREHLGRDVTLVVQHHDVRIVACALQQRIRADRTIRHDALLACAVDGRSNQLFFLLSYRVWIHPADRDPRCADADLFQRCVHRGDRFLHPFPRDAPYGSQNARMQRDVRDAHLAARMRKAQHEDRVLRRDARGARDERRIAVELDPGGVDRALAVRRRDHRGVFAGQGALDRGARSIQGGAAMLGAVKGVDPETGHNYDDTKRYIDRLELTAADKRKIYEGNARRVYPRLDSLLRKRKQ